MSIYTSISANQSEIFNSCHDQWRENVTPADPILQSLRTVCLPGHVYELRCLGYTLNGKWPQTVSGYYDDLGALARDAAAYDGHCKGVYVTLNPVKDALKARSYNRVREGVKDDDTTKDKHILRRVWLPLDFDPERESGISSTLEEHDAALGRARECRDWLRGQDFRDPLLADSGNGGHLLYRLDLPNDDASARLIADFLKMVAGRFSDDRVKVDTAIFNPSRIWKVYGTTACKGDDIEERPHRRSGILEQPATLTAVPKDILERVAGAASAPATSTPTPDTAAPSQGKSRLATSSLPAASFDVPDWLDRHGLAVTKEAPYRGGRKWVLRCCPFSPEHTGGCAVVMQGADGKLGFKCQHNSCKGKGWKALRAHFGEKTEERKQSTASRLKELALGHADLFTTPDGTAYSLVSDNGRRDCFKVASAPFRRWLAGLAEGSGIGPSKNAVADAAFALEARAYRDGTRREVYLRIARVGDRIYVDLADDARRAVEITPDRWRVVTACPVAFVRHENMAPLPLPERGRVDELREHVNVTDEDWPLLRGFILDCLKGDGPYLLGLVNGEQGSAKSTTTKLVRRLVDPVYKAGARRLQRDTNELMIAAERNAVLTFDNVSSLPQWLSDDLASLATGAGMGVRTLYSQDEERVYGVARPILFNGIPDFAESSDLLDRAVKITCPVIPEAERRTDDDVLRGFEAAWPRILGGLFDAISSGLRHYDAVQLPSLPRMAGSAKWITACEVGIGQEGRFYHAYEANRAELNSLALDNSPVAEALLSWLDHLDEAAWAGTASELLKVLKDRVPADVLWQTKFPKTANKLSEELARLAPNLRRAGVLVSREKANGVRRLVIDRRNRVVEPAPAAGHPGEGPGSVESTPIRVGSRVRAAFLPGDVTGEVISRCPTDGCFDVRWTVPPERYAGLNPTARQRLKPYAVTPFNDTYLGSGRPPELVPV